MTPDELQQQEELGRKIAAALAPLGLAPGTIQRMTEAGVGHDGTLLFSARRCRSQIRRNATTFDQMWWASAAGVAAYFEEHGK